MCESEVQIGNSGLAMKIYSIDPLSDPRWENFTARHPHACAFHSKGWLEALRRTYGYEPVAYTTAAPDQELKDGIVFCRVRSWITGRRLVSLPFSDHCQPLVDSPWTLGQLIQCVKECVQREGWKYVELRPQFLEGFVRKVLVEDARLATQGTYYLHVIDIRPDLDTLLLQFHKKSVRHKLNRAKREGLTYEAGNSEVLLEKFYDLLVMTRCRHRVPPQPQEWFRNLIACLGDKITIRIASKGQRPIASILALHCGNSVISKYGCSDARFHHLGGIPLLIWKGIQEGKEKGAEMYDLGRSEPENAGLVAFKNNWGAACSTLTYYRYPSKSTVSSSPNWIIHFARYAFSRMPRVLLLATGRLLYRHIA